MLGCFQRTFLDAFRFLSTYDATFHSVRILSDGAKRALPEAVHLDGRVNRMIENRDGRAGRTMINNFKA